MSSSLLIKTEKYFLQNRKSETVNKLQHKELPMVQRQAIIVNPSFEGNNIFTAGNHLDRDCSNDFFKELREQLSQINVNLDTSDVVDAAEVTFEIHLNVQNNISPSASKRILILLEDCLLVDRDKLKQNQYDIIFTWDSIEHEGSNVKPIMYPNHAGYDSHFRLFSQRKNMLCMIAGNKNLKRNSNLNLYPERVKAIRFFEAQNRIDFSLYGYGWDKFAAKSTFILKMITKLLNLINRYLKVTPFKSYKGPIRAKSEILNNTKFCICFENVSRNNYITEKIIDCFKSGCVPIYWGAPNVSDYIPKNCFIDMRMFNDYQKLATYLSSMSEQQYNDYQTAIREFLTSNYFIETFTNVAICRKIVASLEL